MFTRRAGAGSAKAWRAGANERTSRLESSDGRAGAEARIEGQSWEYGSWRLEDAGGSGDVHCHFVARAPSRKHQVLSCLRCAAVDPEIGIFSLIRSTCA